MKHFAYEDLRVLPGDIVRIHCTGIIAEGQVLSAHSDLVWTVAPDGKHYPIGYQPYAIEMKDETYNVTRYWKAPDGGKVFKKTFVSTYDQVFPRPFGGFTSAEGGPGHGPAS